MTNEINSDLSQFSNASDIWTKWDAARRLMAARQMQTAASESDFHRGFVQLGELCIRSNGLDQLLAIALLVRISEFVKREYKSLAAQFLTTALTHRPENFWIIVDAKKLPQESKPSEIRENIALALSHAAGAWVVHYIVEGLANEDRSARCRTELSRQLLQREASFRRWLELLRDQQWTSIWHDETSDRAGRMRDLAITFKEIFRSDRNKFTVDGKTAPALAELIQVVIFVSPRAPRPAKLAEAAVAIVELLDEILATEFTLLVDPDAYAPLAILAGWWQPSSYPSVVVDALTNLVRKLTSAIRLRARMGQRSASLASRLQQALGSSDLANRTLLDIAEQETGLEPAVDDWLHGRERTTSTTAGAIESLLSDTNTFEAIERVAPLLLDCLDAEKIAQTSNDKQLASQIRRINERIQAMAVSLKLRVDGDVGQVVEFNPGAHRTEKGTVPTDPMVRIVRPMVVQIRSDGSRDIVERAIVAE